MSMKDPDFLRRQVQGHLRSLQGAGVEWLPAAPPFEASQEDKGTGRQGAKEQMASTNGASSNLFDATAAPEEATLSVEQRRLQLKVLAEEVSQCMRCPELASTRKQTVFGQGQPGVELCFVGEAPGADEDAQGLPFVGAAGQLLNKIIAACGLKREEVYICNIIKCRPPGNRTPLPPECSNCRSYLERQIDLVQPKYICALGGCAATNLLSTTESLGKLRKRFHDFRGIPVLVTYHPAYLLPHRHPEKKADVWEDMKFLLRQMGRPIPG